MTDYPYEDFTAKELHELESTYFILIMGGDSVQVDGVYSHTKKEVSKLYNDILKDLIGMAHDGLSEKDRKYAVELIGTLVIQPIRIH